MRVRDISQIMGVGNMNNGCSCNHNNVNKATHVILTSNKNSRS